ncbi:MAG: secretin N-terminal domain-containing protein [Pseudomonadota bacterium]
MQKIMPVFLLLSLCLNSALALAENEFKIITLQHRFVSDLLPTISPMVGAGGTATGVNNQLILRAPPERMREIEALVEKLDAARVNRKITVKNDAQNDSQLQRIEGRGRISTGNVSIGNSRRTTNGGNVKVERNSSSTHQHSNQFISVLDGERAFISNGQVIPFTQEWVSITQRYIQVNTITDWREVTTGFAVRPRTIGNHVELEITPRIASVNNQGFIDFEQLKTIVRVSLGEWVNIGGTMQNNDDVSRKILAAQSSTNTQNSSLSIKVD